MSARVVAMPLPCASCGHAPRHHGKRGCVDGETGRACECSGYVAPSAGLREDMMVAARAAAEDARWLAERNESPAKALHADAILIARFELRGGVVAVSVSLSARRVYVRGPALASLDQRELDALRSALDDAARVLAREVRS